MLKMDLAGHFGFLFEGQVIGQIFITPTVVNTPSPAT